MKESAFSLHYIGRVLGCIFKKQKQNYSDLHSTNLGNETQLVLCGDTVLSCTELVYFNHGFYSE